MSSHVFIRVTLCHSAQDCCKPKCELFECKAPWATSTAKKEVAAWLRKSCADGAKDLGCHDASCVFFSVFAIPPSKKQK